MSRKLGTSSQASPESSALREAALRAVRETQPDNTRDSKNGRNGVKRWNENVNLPVKRRNGGKPWCFPVFHAILGSIRSLLFFFSRRLFVFFSTAMVAADGQVDSCISCTRRSLIFRVVSGSSADATISGAALGSTLLSHGTEATWARTGPFFRCLQILMTSHRHFQHFFLNSEYIWKLSDWEVVCVAQA